MIYFVANWETDDIIAEFDSDAERAAWIEENTTAENVPTRYGMETRRHYNGERIQIFES